MAAARCSKCAPRWETSTSAGRNRGDLMNNKILAIMILVIAGAVLVIPPAVSAGTQPYMFYSEEPWGGSYLGVDTDDITADRVGPLHLKEERGVEVTMVDQDAPAAKAGLKDHDV